MEIQLENGIEKPATESRTISHIVLDNELECILISDPTTKQSAISAGVGVGSYSDPDDLPGLAHYCEHMLFLGTETYPTENYYGKLISSHGGMSNAFTRGECTVFFHTIDADFLEESVECFASFFICPLFTESGSSREAHAVDSEYSMDLQSDIWRKMQVRKAVMNPKSPESKFSIGNLQTLETEPSAKGLDVRQALIDFHAKWYSSNIMKVCIVGKESNEELEGMARKYFNPVVNKHVETLSSSESPFVVGPHKQILHYVPVGDKKSLSIEFQVPQVVDHYLVNPMDFTSNLLGHEGVGSILALLKKKNWANALVSGPSSMTRSSQYSRVYVGIDVTDEGESHLYDIISIVFQYIKMVKEGMKEWQSLFSERRFVSINEFNTMKQLTPYMAAVSIVSNLFTFPAQYALIGPACRQYSQEVLETVWNSLTVENCMIMFASRSAEGKTNLVEKYFQVPYYLEDIPPGIVDNWMCQPSNDDLSFPEINPFLPKSLDLVDQTPIPIPEICKTDKITMWYKPCPQYKQPKVFVGLRCLMKMEGRSVRETSTLKIAIKLINEHLNELLYPATTVGLSYDVSLIADGLLVKVNGYSDSIPLLMHHLFEGLLTRIPIEKDAFERTKAGFLRSMVNGKLNAYTYTLGESQCALGSTQYTVNEEIEDLNSLCYEDFSLDTYFSYWNDVIVEGLAVGNLDCEYVTRMSHDLEDIATRCGVNISSRTLVPKRFAIEEGLTKVIIPCQNPKDDNCCVVCTMLNGESNLKAKAHAALFNSLVKESCFDSLRTKQQLGYVVLTTSSPVRFNSSISVIVQSSVATVPYVETMIEKFLYDFGSSLRAMPLEEFGHVKKARIESLTKPLLSIEDEFDRFYASLSGRTYDFELYPHTAETTSNISLESMIDYYETYISPVSSKRTVVTTCLSGNNHTHDCSVPTDGWKPHHIQINGGFYKGVTVCGGSRSVWTNPPHFPKSHPIQVIPYSELTSYKKTLAQVEAVHMADQD